MYSWLDLPRRARLIAQIIPIGLLPFRSNREEKSLFSPIHVLLACYYCLLDGSPVDPFPDLRTVHRDVTINLEPEADLPTGDFEHRDFENPIEGLAAADDDGFLQLP
jgi:hypothetical protein